MLQCHSLGLVNESSPSIISIEGENRKEGTCSPTSDTLFSHVNAATVLDRGHHLPFFRVWAPSPPDESHCLRVSKQKAVSRHVFLFFSLGQKGSSINSTSLLFSSLHVTWGGSCSRALCAVTSRPSAVCSTGSV